MLITLVDNPGRAAPSGFNTGLKHATGDVLIIFSAHAVADTAFVRANVEALRETNAAAVGGPIDTQGSGELGQAIAAAVSHPFGVGNARFRYSDEPGYVDTIAFAAYRRECFDVIGGFRLDRVLAVDDFFNYEIRREGGRLWLTPEIKSTYYSRSTVTKLAKQYFGYGKAKGRTMTETPDTILPRHLVPAAAVAGGATLAVLGLLFRPARRTLIRASSAYLGLSMFAAKRACDRRAGDAKPPLVAAMFAVIHATYGVGTILGAVNTFKLRRRPPSVGD